MNRKVLLFFGSVLCLASGFGLTGCNTGKVSAKQDSDTAPPPAQVEADMDPGNFKVDNPAGFPLVTAGSHVAAPELNVTGVTSPDVSKQVPVISTATGRIIEIDARVGDEVRKDQLLFKVKSTDIAGAFSDYRKAMMMEQLMKKQLDRSEILLKDGAIPTSQLEIAQKIAPRWMFKPPCRIFKCSAWPTRSTLVISSRFMHRSLA
jgi:membrane fusion protein, heavy metal efflux system